MTNKGGKKTLNNSSVSHAEYAEKHNAVCKAVTDLYGDFKRDFVLASDSSEKDVRNQICERLSNSVNCNDVERYIFVSEINGSTIIKK